MKNKYLIYNNIVNRMIIILLMFFCAYKINAQVPTCDEIDTTHWQRLNTIPIDSKCVGGFYMRDPSALIGFFTHFKISKCSDCDEFKSIDIRKYNLIIFSCTTGGCKQALVKYSLFENGTKVPFLKISIVQFGTCKVNRGIRFYCLVLKKLCPKKPKFCITNKIIEDKKL